MQRQANTSRGVELPQISQSSSMYSDEMKIDESSVLPLFRRHSGEVKRGISRSRCQPETKLLLIPAVVILCFLILWLSSYPVKLEMKNGRMVGATREMMQQNTYFANLASIFTPYPSISENGGQ